MNWETLKSQGIVLASALANSSKTNAEKLRALEDFNVEVIEQADDELVKLVPEGFRGAAKFAVDNPLVDGIQRTLVARPLAEAEYQAFASLKSTLHIDELKQTIDVLATESGGQHLLPA